MPPPVRPADTPRSQEAQCQEAEVEEQRERVAMEQQDPSGVEQLGILRVEPVREDGLRVVQPRDGVALHHVHRKRHVVPERIEVEDPPVQCVLGREPPVRKHQGDHPDGHRPRQPRRCSGGWRRRGARPRGRFSDRRGWGVPCGDRTRRQQRLRSCRQKQRRSRRGPSRKRSRTVPRSSPSQMSRAMATTDSTRRAGAPCQLGKKPPPQPVRA